MHNNCKDHNGCIDSALNNAESICFDSNLKFTPLRKRILKLIWESHQPIKAYDILGKLNEEDNSIKPITLYRILDLFLEKKLIHKIESQNSFLGCNHPREKHNCFFIICKICKKVEEGCAGIGLENIHTYMLKKEFIVDSINLEIHGTCKNCSHSN